MKKIRPWTEDQLKTLGGCLWVLLLWGTILFLVAAIGPALNLALLIGIGIYFICTLFPPIDDPPVSLQWYHKISMGISASACVILLVALLAVPMHWRLPYSFYICLRAIVFVAILHLICFRLQLWFRLCLIAWGILYNPILIVTLGSRVTWSFFNIGILPFFVVAWFIILRGRKLGG